MAWASTQGLGHQGLGLHHSAASHSQEQVESLRLTAGREASRSSLQPTLATKRATLLGNRHLSRALALASQGDLGLFTLGIKSPR